MPARKLPYIVVNQSGPLDEPYQIEIVFASNYLDAECLGLVCYGMADCTAYVYSPDLHSRITKANNELAAGIRSRKSA